MSEKKNLPGVRAESNEPMENVALDFVPKLVAQFPGQIKSIPLGITFENPRLDLQTMSLCADSMEIGINIILK